MLFVCALPAAGVTPPPAPAAARAPAAPSAATSVLTLGEARERGDLLRREIAHDDALYFRQAAPEISDFAYDQLKRELADLEAAFPQLSEGGGPQLPVGDDRTGLFPVCRHIEPMSGLDKTYSEAELRAFLGRLVRRIGREDVPVVIEPKIDGFAVSVTYEHGRLVRVVTRGNGAEGDEITANARTIRSLPRELRRMTAGGVPNPMPELIELRGEIYLTWAEFARINQAREKADEPLFAHPRNLAAATARLLDPREVAARRLEIVFYGWGAWEPAAMRPATQHGFHEQARAWGLPTLEKYWIARGADEIWAAVREFGQSRRNLTFPADGAVVKLDAVAWRRDAGETHRAPRWAMAFKFAPERVETKLLSIAVQVGRTGLLTPVAEFAPVRIAGSTVARATLHNSDVIARLDLRIGDFIYLEKAGEIIPAIGGVNLAKRQPGSEPYVFPRACPACGTEVVQLEGEAAVRCPNSACPAQIRRRILHFASKACLDIDGLGPATIDALVTHGRVGSVADLYRLRREDLLALDRDRGRVADSLFAAIERSKRGELWRFIYGLSIPRVGAVAARSLARRSGSLHALVVAHAEDLGAVPRGSGPRIGAATINAVLTYFSLPQNRAVVAEMVALGVNPAAPAPANEPAESSTPQLIPQPSVEHPD